MLHNYLILICIVLIIFCINKWSRTEYATFDKDGLDCVLNMGDNTVYIFNNEMCLKYIIKDGVFKKKHGYPKKISVEFSGIPSNIRTAFLQEKNKLVFLKGEKAYLYNLNTKSLESGYPKNISLVYDEFLVDASCIIPYEKNTFVVFKNNRFAMYKTGTKITKTHQIRQYLPSFFENIHAGTNWGFDRHNLIYYFFKNDKYIKYQIKKRSKSDIFGKGYIKGDIQNLNNYNWPGINSILDTDSKKAKTCPAGYELLSNKIHCKNNKGKICSLDFNMDRRFPVCKSSCALPITSSGGIKYNELVLFKIFPNNFLGENENPLLWTNSNVFVIEPEGGCIKTNSSKIVMWGDVVKLKNVVSQEYLKLSNNNDLNTYKIIKSDDVSNSEYVSDNDNIKLCVEHKNDVCINFYQNGVNDNDSVITIIRVDTASNLKNKNKIVTINSNNSVEVEDQTPSVKVTEADYDPENEKYCDHNQSDYRGTINQTESGNNCLNWDSNGKHQITDNTIEKHGIGHHNYCRNPKGSKEKAWCYSSKPNTVWEYCKIGEPDLNCQNKIQSTSYDMKYNTQSSSEQNQCNKYKNNSDLEDYCNSDGSDYRGTINWSSDNLQCKKWPESFQQIYSERGVGDHNFCRNPDQSNNAWCFVDDKDKPIRSCNIGAPNTICKNVKNSENEICYTKDCIDYKGRQNITIKGTECIPWNSRSLGSRAISTLNHNFCRNPASAKKEMPWCYTKNGNWEYCDIPVDKNINSKDIYKNKVLCSFSIPEAKVYYLFRTIIINNNPVIIYNVLNFNHQSKMIGIVNDITWPGLPFKDHIDAAFYHNNIVYFFNGSQIAKYDVRIKNQDIFHMKGKLTSIGNEFPNLDFKSGINCIISTKNNLSYVIKDNNYVLFDFSTGVQESANPNQLSRDVIKNISVSNIDAAITFEDDTAYLFKDNYYVKIIDVSSHHPTQTTQVPNLIGTTYKIFWNININNPLFNKQQILIENTNLINIIDQINKIKNKGGFQKYIETTKEDIYAISKKFNVTVEQLLESIENGIFEPDADNKADTYNDPPTSTN